ncbi:MAG: hypothetical protein ACK48Y_00570, partial [Planctomyces sp.]
LVFLGGFWLLVLSLPLSDSQPRGSDLAVKLIMGGTATFLVYVLLWLPVIVLEANARRRSARSRG